MVVRLRALKVVDRVSLYLSGDFSRKGVAIIARVHYRVIPRIAKPHMGCSGVPPHSEGSLRKG